MKIWQVIFLTSGFLFILNCGRPINNEKETLTTTELSFGTESTFDIITWNLEQFPKLNDSTIFYLVKLINELNVEIIPKYPTLSNNIQQNNICKSKPRDYTMDNSCSIKKK